MGSINDVIGANAAIDFGALAAISNGKYNMGEIVGKADRKGRFTFKKINNHVGFYHDRNNVRTTEEQNRVTNMAVFKAILTRYGGLANRANEFVPDDGRLTIDDILSRDISTEEGRTEVESALNSFGPYVKEAFRYLLLDGNDKRPLSRDELHRLIELLDGRDADREVRKNMDDLAELRQFKRYGDRGKQNVLQQIRGLGVRNISNAARARVLTVSDNQRDATELQDGLLLVSDADVELLNRKGVDLLAAFRYRDGALKNVPSLHVLATMAKKGGWTTTEELLRNVQKFLDDTSCETNDPLVFDCVRAALLAQKGGEVAGEEVQLAYDRFRTVLDDAVLRIAGSGGKAAAIRFRAALLRSLTAEPGRCQAFVDAIGKLVRPGGLDDFMQNVLPRVDQSIGHLRREVGKIRSVLLRQGLASGSPFAKDPVDVVLQREFNVDVVELFALGMTDVEKLGTEVQAAQRLVGERLADVRQSAGGVRKDAPSGDGADSAGPKAAVGVDGSWPELPNLADQKDVVIVVRNAYPQGVGDDVIESAQKDIRGTLKDLDLIRDSNEALVKVAGKRPTFREAFVDYWNHITAGGAEHDVLRFGQILQAVANSGPFVDGGDPRELARKTVSLIYSQVLKAVNDVEDLTYEVIRSTIRHVFTDAAAKFLGQPDYSRTKASDVLMTLWSMTDQALAVLMNAYPEPEKTQKREQTEKDFFDRRVTQLEANPEDRAFLERSRALLERDRLRALRTRADVGTWPEVGDRVFLRVDAMSEDQTQKVNPFKANLLLGSKDNVQDVRVKDDVILFKPKGENEPGDWSLFFGEDWSQVPKETENFFAEFAKLADDPDGEQQIIDDFIGFNDEIREQTRSSMPGTSKALADEVEKLANSLYRRMREVLDPGAAFPSRFWDSISDACNKYQERVAGVSPDEQEDVRNPTTLKAMLDENLVACEKELEEQRREDVEKRASQGREIKSVESEHAKTRDLLLGAKLLLDHALDRIADGWPNSNVPEPQEEEEPQEEVEEPQEEVEEPQDDRSDDEDEDNAPLDNS